MADIKKFRYSLKFASRYLFFKFWYRLISMLDKKAEVQFMNYGYNNPEQKLHLKAEEEPHRYSIHLYHQLIHKHDLKNKSLLEVGCGRGGGLAYIKRQFKPARAVGLDLDKLAVDFCRKHHRDEGLEFQAGNAHRLPFEDNSFDCVINVESSHRYENNRQFLSEVRRILRPGGVFLVTDFRRNFQVEKFHNELVSSNLILLGRENITSNVTRAIELNDNNRIGLIKRIAPFFLQKIAMEFAGVKNSDVYRNFASGRWTYLNYYLQKNS